MDSINTKVAAIFTVNLLIVLTLILNQYSSGPLVDLSQKPNFAAKYEYSSDFDDSEFDDSDFDDLDFGESLYKFDDPTVALQLLEQLDIFQEINDGELSGANYTGLAGGFGYNDEYCSQHRAYFVDSPEIVFNEVNVVSNYWKSHDLRNEVIPEVAYDLHPEVTAGNKQLWTKFEYDIDPIANLFFMHNFFFLKRQVGKQFSCLSQESNHIPGHDNMIKKDKLKKSLASYAEKYQSKPECFNFDRYFQKKLDVNALDQLLFNNQKFTIRTYLLIASVNPVIACYHNGYYTVSAEPNSTKTYGLNKDLQKYLLESGTVDDPKFVRNYLIPEYKRAMVHLVRMTQNDFFKISSAFELFAIDFVLDNNLDVWFVDANPTPLLQGFSEKTTKLMNKMLMDTFEIVIGLLRSRMKRVVLFINEISKELPPNSAEIPSLGQKRHVFQNITMNRFEPEYIPSKENGFQKIIDENKEGTKRYTGLIDQECL